MTGPGQCRNAITTHTGSGGWEALCAPYEGAQMPTPMHQHPQRERECHLTMPHTHTHQKGVCVIEKQRGDGMDGDTHLADEVAHTNGVAK